MPAEAENFWTDEKQSEFRNAAAGLIKSLIRARAVQEPQFLSVQEYGRWGVTNLDSEKRSCAALLTHVGRLREQFETRIFSGLDSIPEPIAGSAADGIDELIEQVAGFIRGDLDEAIRTATADKKVRWNRLAGWDSLPALRDRLDRLPSLPQGNAHGRHVVEVPKIKINKKGAVITWKGTRYPVDHKTAEAFASATLSGRLIGY